jgi:hypothetical protein
MPVALGRTSHAVVFRVSNTNLFRKICKVSGENMTYEAQREIQKALRSLPWYMFLVPTLVTLFLSLFDSPGPHSIWSDTRPEYGYWALMWIVAKLGLFIWILRQLLRFAVFQYSQRMSPM